ncbi:MAG: phosphotransferase [Pirellulaceae bacterium]|nr:phosphotransferase [Pirellulaceae bacterium]
MLMHADPRQLDQTLIGTGLTADVHAWKDGQVLKLFHQSFTEARVTREYEINRAVHAAGLPVPAAYEVIRLEERFGIVLERIEGPSMFANVQSRPWTLFAAARQMAELHAQLHSHPAPPELPSQRAWIESRINSAIVASESEQNRARQLLGELPAGDALCHGDFHPGNILLTARGPIIIDWSTATRGHPLGDVACTSHLFENADLPVSASRTIRLLFMVSRSLLHTTYLRRYLRLRPGMRSQINKWRVLLTATLAARKMDAITPF